MFVGPDYSSLLAPLLAYLLSRALVGSLGGRLGSAGPVIPVVLGALASAIPWTAVGIGPSVSPAWLYPVAADAACAVAMLAVGAETGFNRRGSRPSAPASPRRIRRAAALAVPAAVGLALAIGFGSAYGSGPVPIARTALALAAALWLSTDKNGPGLAAAGLALAFVGQAGVPSAAAISAAIGCALFIAAIGSSGRFVPAMPALALGLAWSLSACGATWPAAGLAAGFAVGLARRALADRGTGGPALQTAAARRLAERPGLAVAESSHALAFVAGLGLASGHLVESLPAIFIIAAAMLASAILRGLVEGGRGLVLPTEAAVFAAMLAAKRAGLVSDASITGAALACLAAAPFAGRRLDLAREVDARAMKAIVGISTEAPDRGAVSFAAALAAPDEPVRAVCVAVPAGSPGPNPGQAEEALVRCVVAGTSAGVRVLPSVIVDDSVAAGLARIARERRSDAVILGLGDRSRSTLDELLGIYPGSVIAIRRPEAYASSRRLVVLTVSGAEAAPGFPLAIGAAARAWGRPSRTIDAMMVGAHGSALVDAAKGAIDPGSTLSVQSWRDVPAALESLASQRLGFVVFSARPGSKAWNPGHDRLPVVLDAAFPESAIALWYAATEAEVPETDAARAAAQPSSGAWPPLVAAAFDSGRILPDMREAAMVDAIRRLTDAVYPGDRGASGRLAAEFSAIARKEPIELAPGVLLLHAHAHGVSMPTLAIGSRPAGWPLVALSSPVRITVVLISPVESGPETHLEALTQIASAFRNLGLADRLLSGSSEPAILPEETPPSLAQ